MPDEDERRCEKCGEPRDECRCVPEVIPGQEEMFPPAADEESTS